MLPSIFAKRRVALPSLYRIGSSPRLSNSSRAVSSQILDSVSRKDFASALQQFRQSKTLDPRLTSDRQRLVQSYFDLLTYLVRMVSTDVSLVKPIISDKLSELAEEFGNETSISQSRMTELMAEIEQLPAMDDDALIVLAAELYSILLAGHAGTPKEAALACQAANLMLRLYALTAREAKMHEVYLQMRSLNIPRSTATFQHMLRHYTTKTPQEMTALTSVTSLIWDDLNSLAPQEPKFYPLMMSYLQLQGREAYDQALLLLRNELKPRGLHESLSSAEWAWLLCMHPHFWTRLNEVLPLESGPIQEILSLSKDFSDIHPQAIQHYKLMIQFHELRGEESQAVKVMLAMDAAIKATQSPRARMGARVEPDTTTKPDARASESEVDTRKQLAEKARQEIELKEKNREKKETAQMDALRKESERIARENAAEAKRLEQRRAIKRDVAAERQRYHAEREKQQENLPTEERNRIAQEKGELLKEVRSELQRYHAELSNEGKPPTKKEIERIEREKAAEALILEQRSQERIARVRQMTEHTAERQSYLAKEEQETELIEKVLAGKLRDEAERIEHETAMKEAEETASLHAEPLRDEKEEQQLQLDKEIFAAEQAKEELARIENERIENERIERERIEDERIERERIENGRIEEEEKKALEREGTARLEREAIERAEELARLGGVRIAQEQRDREMQQARIESERQSELARVEAERAELEQLRIEKETIAENMDKEIVYERAIEAAADGIVEAENAAELESREVIERQRVEKETLLEQQKLQQDAFERELDSMVLELQSGETPNDGAGSSAASASSMGKYALVGGLALALGLAATYLYFGAERGVSSASVLQPKSVDAERQNKERE